MGEEHEDGADQDRHRALELGGILDRGAGVERQHRDVGQRHLQFARVGGAVGGVVGLALLGLDHDEVDQDAGDLHLLGRQGAAARHALHLHHDDAALAFGGLRLREHFQEHGLLLHGDVAVLVGRGAAQKADIDLIRLVEEILLAPERDALDQVLGRALALPPAAVAGIDEGVQAGLGQEARPPGRHLAHELREGTLRQGVGLDLVRDREVRNLGRVHKGPGDAAPQKALGGEMLRPLGLAVPQPDRMQLRDAARRPLGQKASFERGEQRLGHGVPAAGAADQERVAGSDHADGFIGGDASQGGPPIKGRHGADLKALRNREVFRAAHRGASAAHVASHRAKECCREEPDAWRSRQWARTRRGGGAASGSPGRCGRTPSWKPRRRPGSGPCG
ncbi:MAG: hypothetical protein AVDCRST_MAG90-2919 [uncultured Microvirga sp.]|uniref:Uncharacterized protein n=1 Tax=uncultured Microvirga sp. TaxID=412392 RepID=A0A6J4MGR1_9HYPH|nr:MAG: hypothetical protein AVDCRST_MAG90-2919 [uncultured Microvirga sp.]